MLGENRKCKVTAEVKPPRGKPVGPEKKADAEAEETPETKEDKKARQAFLDQNAVLNKLRTIAEDSRTYENDTGVHVLRLGFPLLSIPVGQAGQSRRIMAPLAFIALSLNVRKSARPAVELNCQEEGVNLVVANDALLAWLQQQTGVAAADLIKDEAGEKPWHEIVSIVQAVAGQLKIAVPPLFENGDDLPVLLEMRPAPRADQDHAEIEILPAAVLGLYPATNQGLLSDTQAMMAEAIPEGPLGNFLNLNQDLTATPGEAIAAPPMAKKTRQPAEERLVSEADPCQARAVKLARTSKALVVHGPPGTGKSQTIANIIGDHLARGERVLFVCDKRTALDVVMNRLEALQLGSLCAVVHDAQRDQKDLYRSIREQLDNLGETRSSASAESKLRRLDNELRQLHDELSEFHRALMQRPDPEARSFHELMGDWLSLPGADFEYDTGLLQGMAPAEIENQHRPIAELLDRAVRAQFASNPWSSAVGLSLDQFLAAPQEESRNALASLDAALTPLEQTVPVPPFPDGKDCHAVATARVKLADELSRLVAEVAHETRQRWARADAKRVATARQDLGEIKPIVERIESARLDAELSMMARSAALGLPAIAVETVALERYAAIARRWYGLLAFGRKAAAAAVLTRYGLTASADNAERVLRLLTGWKERLLVKSVLEQLGCAPSTALPPDDELVASYRQHAELASFLHAALTEPLLANLVEPIRQALAAPQAPAELLAGLRASPARAERLAQCEQALRQRLFSADFREGVMREGRAGVASTKTSQELRAWFDSLEDILRVHAGFAAFPGAFRSAIGPLLERSVAGELGLQTLKKAALAHEISLRIKANQPLVLNDGAKLQSSFERYRQLDEQKKALARDVILHRWTTRQRERLLVSTGSRLSGEGAELRRRLTLRGEKALRLRQVVSLGHEIEGGDPLFDLRPVWMASPETVAQVLPRRSMFDAVIFDEASQCRLEEALPVLLRAKRVVIAGDPKQLPPTRFFESAVATSEDEEIDTDQDLFEKQQGEMEDLLSAALNIEIEEAYLDVHYRSRNSDLIAFSNQNFYNARLQAIPGHPANRTRYAPLTLYKANGVYDERANVVEAERVCGIVRDLLKRAEPPSIGIACFNITQRDLIIDKLDELATQDAEFGRSLTTARERRGRNSFEGLFVKNLENVQGDERDHIIISTTYGPDPKGRFYRRFGPVGRAGGGRRLNVLVTRARDEVHLVTSIPETVYRNLPPIPPGGTAGGVWLLFDYLRFAEHLAVVYEEGHQKYEQANARQEVLVHVRDTRFPSSFAQMLAQQLKEGRQIGSDVHWGNDGFCVDLALHHPRHAEDVTIGVQCDLNRFEQAADPIEWEVFRNWVLHSQGWKINRVWSPQFFRDGKGVSQKIVAEVEDFLAHEPEKDAIRVEG